MRVFLTGDTHGGIDIRKLYEFNIEHPELTKEDLVIILGDFGVIWDELDEYTYSLIDQYEQFRFSVAFVLGNHEGYDLLKTFPKEEWNGGTVRRISDSIVQLENGEIYSINEINFFVMGGAESIDKKMRKPHVSWWPQEIPSSEIRIKGLMNLLGYASKKGCLPDMILTHTPPAAIIEEMHPSNHIKMDDYAYWLNNFLTLEEPYGIKWYCAHMHEDISIKNPFIKKLDDANLAVDLVEVLYNSIIEI